MGSGSLNGKGDRFIYSAATAENKSVPFFSVQAESVFKANPALRETSIKVDGYYFQVTRKSNTGEITNSFITMPPRTN